MVNKTSIRLITSLILGLVLTGCTAEPPVKEEVQSDSGTSVTNPLKDLETPDASSEVEAQKVALEAAKIMSEIDYRKDKCSVNAYKRAAKLFSKSRAERILADTCPRISLEQEELIKAGAYATAEVKLLGEETPPNTPEKYHQVVSANVTIHNPNGDDQAHTRIYFITLIKEDDTWRIDDFKLR